MSTLLAAGDKKLQTSLFSYFTGVDCEGAVDLYEQAANTLKGQRDFQGAASVYIHKLLPIAEKAGASRWQQSTLFITISVYEIWGLCPGPINGQFWTLFALQTAQNPNGF